VRGHRLLVLFSNNDNFDTMDNFIKKVVEPVIIVLLIGFIIVMSAIYVALKRNFEAKQKSTYKNYAKK